MHVVQLAEQAVWQQTFWAQIPELHCGPVLHWLPSASVVPQAPVAVLQVAPGAQSAFDVQVILQTLLGVSQARGSHRDWFTVRQVPAPSQVRAGVSVVPMQLWSTQTVPGIHWRQCPEPSQVPSVPQVDIWVAGHWVGFIGSVLPAPTIVQVPWVPVSAHDWQVPLQALLQQKPCAQTSGEAHSVLVIHARPCGLSVQAPALQMFGLTQSLSAEQGLTLHWLALVSQTKLPPHMVLVAVTQ